MTKNQSLILYPGLQSRLIIKNNNTLVFCCQAEQDYTMELWSNLTAQKNWIAFPFTKLRDYHLVINTQNLEPGYYEFTLRFKLKEEPWSWYGNPGENGRVYIISSLPVIAPIISQLYLMAEELIESVNLWHFKAPLNQSAYFSLGNINQDAYVVCIKKGSCWLTPIGGQTEFKHDANQQWQLLLYKEQGNLHLWVPIGQKTDAWLSPGSKNKISLCHNVDKGAEAHLLIASTTTDDFSYLIKTALAYYKRVIREDQDEIEYKSMAILESLGYCTWNAFGKTVDKEKLFEALHSLQSNNIPIKYVIIDDGWQEIANERITSMDTCKKKFPDGLKEIVSQIKLNYPFVEFVGVWHALWGYWNGIDEDFAKDYGYYSVMDNKNSKIGLIRDPKKFYRDFYSFLRGAGIDFVKVDNQGSFQDLVIEDKISVWDLYRTAMIESAEEFLQGNVIHSMALTPHILLNPILSRNHQSIFRNSDDFFPNEDKSHVWHIYANAINALWKTPALVGDWDMFQSCHPFAEYHATSRAISGGPIYITDIPNRHNTELVHKLVGQTRFHGYTVLITKQSPYPTFDTVFGNPIENESVLGLCNLHREKHSKLEYGICGFWNSGPHDQLGIIARKNWKGINMNRVVAYVVSGSDKGKLMQLDFSGYGRSCSSKTNSISCVMSVWIKGLESCLVSVSAIRSLEKLSVACLGLIDKFNGTASILKTSLDQHYEAHLTHRSSCCAFWINTKPRQVVLDGQSLKLGIDWKWNKNNGLLLLDMMVIPLGITTDDTFCVQIYM